MSSSSQVGRRQWFGRTTRPIGSPSRASEAPATASGTDSGLSWDGAMMVGIGTLVVVLALGLGFGYVRRPRLAGL